MSRDKKKTRFIAALWVSAFLFVAYAHPTPAFNSGNYQGSGNRVADICPEATTLETLVSCIKKHMPGSGSEQYLEPAGSVRSSWKKTVRRMLAGNCNPDNLPEALRGIYWFGIFRDSSSGADYCVLMETSDRNNDGMIDYGFGTFIVNRNFAREIIVQVPHPLFDRETPEEGIGIFKGADAHAFLLAGSHRHANSRESLCQEDFYQADAAHNVSHLFQAATEEMKDYYKESEKKVTVIQFHGMADSRCEDVDVYLTHGSREKARENDGIVRLKENLKKENPHWAVSVPGDAATCSLHGTKNVQGRLFNGVNQDSVCEKEAEGYSGSFIHIEQKKGFRNPEDWVKAIRSSFPEVSRGE